MDKLLITTVKKLVLWDGKQNNILEGNFYGLTWNKKSVFINKNLNTNDSIIDEYSKEFKLLKTIVSVKNGNIHQICYNKNKLYATCTGLGIFKIINIKTNHIDSILLEGHGHHNSVYCANNKIVVLDSQSQNGLFRIRTIDTNETNTILSDQMFITRYPSLHHNIFLDNENIVSCYHRTDGSRMNKIIIFKPLELTFEYKDPRKDKENGFMRGLAKNKDNYFIGEFQHENIRENRLMGNSRILITDNEFKLIDTIELTDTGQIRDVRLLSDDLAHNERDF